MSNGLHIGIQKFFESSRAKGEVYAQHRIASVFSKESDYQLLLNKCEDHFKVNTNIPVAFSPKMLLAEMNQNDVRNIFQARFFKIHNKDLDVTIEGYKRGLNNSKLMIQFHFFKGEVFFVRHTFKYNEGEDLRILKLFAEKYELTNLADIFDCAIVDPNQIAIYVEQVFGLEISYLNLNATFFKDLKQNHLNAELERQRREDEDQNRIMSIL